jgi:Protein of unknown function (DUF1553)/Protein of unknown function (DUF1549)/Planctomycete cytochrome C
MKRVVMFTVSMCIWTVAVRTSAADQSALDYQSEIAPLLKTRCVRCHGPAVTKAKLNLAVPTGVVRGGKSGRAIVSGKPEESLLWQRVAADEMPEDAPLPPEEKVLLRRWIAAGAPGLPTSVSEQPDGDEHWAYQVLRSLSQPPVREASSLHTPVDNFIETKLKAAGLTIGPEADRNTLIRRVSFDLTGLPPTLEEIATFVADKRDAAYENMVEHYLASPRYGERWGKYWLDAAGYADSNGYFNADTDRPLAYRYRDYVVRSINADKPWDQFIREQLAGDELARYKPGADVSPDKIELLEATHYLRNSPDGTDSSDGNPDELRTDKFAVLEGTMQIIGASLLGLTVQCAKCHDHKFEPFTQQDYYALQAVIYPAFNVEKWVKPKQREIVTASSAEIAAWEAHSKQIDEQIANRRQQFSEWLSKHRERGKVLFQDSFDRPDRKLADDWTNIVPGDEAPAGQPPVNLDSPAAPGAQLFDGHLRIVESGDTGDRVVSSKRVFDWTPNEPGTWVQVTFDLLPGSDTAPYVGFLLAMRDFNDARGTGGGNVLIDASAAGMASVHVDYPGGDSKVRGQIGRSACVPGHNFGVRITNQGNNRFELAFIVDGLLEEGTATLAADDLPDGSFGFEYCCGRSFAIDNVVIETSDSSLQANTEYKQLADLRKRMREEFDADVKKLESQKGDQPGRLAAVYDLSAEPPDVFLLDRGDYKSPKEKVQAAAPHALCDSSHPSFLLPPTAQNKGSTGRRLAFARWLTESNGRAAALLARVTVNRMWQQHFGTGIVATADNLGYSGAAPSHPELIEFLASEFVRSGWSAKAIHRLILNSATFRQSSRPPGNAKQVDPENRLLGRFPLRRLDAEAIRDGMLAACGELDLHTGGPFVPTLRDDEGAVIVSESTMGAHRRSIFLQQRRTQVPGLLQVFDGPSIVFSCTFRTTTTVPLQSLTLLNSSFVRLRAKALANRIAAAAGNDSNERIRYAFLLVAARPPTDSELVMARSFINQQPQRYNDQPNAEVLGWIDFCQMLLASNALLYVE